MEGQYPTGLLKAMATDLAVDLADGADATTIYENPPEEWVTSSGATNLNAGDVINGALLAIGKTV